MKRVLPWLLGASILGVFVAAALYLDTPEDEPQASPHTPPQRVVCLAPSLTEIVFAIGAGSQVVGVSTFTTWPPEAAALPKLGGHHDPHLEAIIALNPDHIITMGHIPRVAENAARLNLPITELPTDTLPEVLAAIRALGVLMHRVPEAEALASRIEDGLATLRAQTAGQPRPRTLIVVGREPGAIRGVYSVSSNAFLNTLLEIAGGDNAIQRDAPWPQLSIEEIVRASPELILEIAPGLPNPEEERAKRLALWQRELPHLPAVRHGQLQVLTQEHLLLPGPRLLDTAKTLRDVLQKASRH